MLRVSGISTAVLAELFLDHDTAPAIERPDGVVRHGTYRTLGERRRQAVLWAGFDLPPRRPGMLAAAPKPDDDWT